jgi:uncharacterized membrane protein
MREKSTLRNLLENCLFVWLGLSIVLSLSPESTEFPSIFQVIGRSHPLLLHFPIVLLLAGIIFFITPSLRENNEVKNIGELIFLAGANFAGITVVAGLILAKEDYEGEALNWHQWAGFLVFAFSVFIYFFRNISSKTIGFSAMILAIGVILTGHWGANLTHGEDFLLAPLNTEESQVPTMAEAEVFRDIIQPILEAKCVTCHREGKIKGELRLDHLEGIQKGGKTGPFALAGDLENSMVVQRISLPMDAKEHMPPKNKAQLSEEELSILKEWVANGARFDQKMEELEKESKLYQFASLRFQPERRYEFEAASPETVKELNNFYRAVMPLYPESPALAVSYFGIAAFDPASLNDLKKVKTQVVELSLNKMPLGNLDLGFLEDFNNLEKLTLNFSGLSSKQIAQLGKLSSLQELALSGNNLQQESVKILSQMNHLKKLFLWQTGLSDSQKNELKKNLPTTRIDFGFDGKGIIYELNPPKISQAKTLFKDSLELELSHPIPVAEIRYTLDGTEPDSLNSPIYAQPIWINQSGKIQAKVFAPDWKSSPTVSSVYMKSGLSPSDSKLLNAPNPRYQAQGASTLFDQIKGKNNHTSGEWLGYSDQAFEAEFEIPENQNVESLGLSLLYHESAYIFPPTQVEIFSWEDGRWKSIIRDQPKQSEKIGEIRSELLQYKIQGNSPQKIKVKLNPISSLPAWHPGAGAKGWVFIDEILLN